MKGAVQGLATMTAKMPEKKDEVIPDCGRLRTTLRSAARLPKVNS
jgi:hypothetical protein